MDPELKKISKFLSLVLRHDPGKIGIELDAGGWTGVDGLLAAMAQGGRGKKIDLDTLRCVVETNDKGRFEFSDDGACIRARQGHSVHVELGNERLEPPECLYHGTPEKFVESIRSGGLLKMSRHAVHLSPDYDTAVKVGSRRGKPVILKVRAKVMHEDGHQFFLTENSVWYTDRVPPEYLLWPEDRQYNSIGSQSYPAPDLR
jgi:putative RNA 2'-phosphotransferase